MSTVVVSPEAASVPLPPSADPQAIDDASTLTDPLAVDEAPVSDDGEESPVAASAATVVTEGAANDEVEEKGGGEASWPSEALDTIESLRTELTASREIISQQTTKVSTLTDLATEHSQLKDQHAFLTAAKEAVELRLKEEQKKREIAEENVELLRGQVEQARRGVMALQKQDADRKRMSVMSNMGLGLSGQGDEELLAGLAEASSRDIKASRRTSMMGRSHRRVSSQSEPNDIPTSLERQTFSPPAPSAVPRLTGGLRELRLSSNSPNPVNIPSPPALSPATNIHNGYFDDMQSQAAITTANKEKMIALDEAAQLRNQMGQIQAKYVESEEARVATELCLKVLREFLASHNCEGDKDGEGAADLLKGISLPPLPTDREYDDEPQKESSKSSGWGFKLWSGGRQATSPTPPAAEALSPGTSIVTTPNPISSPLPGADDGSSGAMTPGAGAGLSSFVSSWTKGVSAGAPVAISPNMVGMQRANSANKLSVGGFFRRRGDTTASQNSQPTEKDLPPHPSSPSGQGEEGVELASPIIRSAEEKEYDRRKSHGTTVTDLEEELGTPLGDLQEAGEGEEAEGDGKTKVREMEQLDEISI